MPTKPLYRFAALVPITLLAACGGGGSSGGGNNDGNSNREPTNQEGTPPSQYVFESKFIEGGDAVAYPGQTTRHVLIADLTSSISSLPADSSSGDPDPIKQKLDLFIRGEAIDTTDYQFSLGEETLYPFPTYGDISMGKNLVGKIAGGDGAGGGETETLQGDYFIGWQDGMDKDPLPIELVDYYIDQIATLATDGNDPQVAISGGTMANIGLVYVDEYGRDFRQLTQKFLLGAVALSQGTADYLQTDFAANNTQSGDAPYTTAEHKWDEAFGYLGAARDYNDYTDNEIAGASGRPEYENGYHDMNGDGLIDLRSEVNFGNSVNCGKRDRGASTDFTKTAFDAFLKGRYLLNEAANSEAGLTADALSELNEQIRIAATTWEKCVAATVVHYINDVLADMDAFDNGTYASLDNFLNLAKHWSEMKGFALGFQFNPYSPFNDASVTEFDVDDLKEILAKMGDAPVLADGSQLGIAPAGTAEEAIQAYRSGLLDIRATLKDAYGFSASDVEGW